MDERTMGLIGGIVGGLLGMVGGGVGTYYSLKNAASPHQRIRMARLAALTWVVVTAGLAWLILGPRPRNQFGMAVCFAPLFVMIWMDRRQARAQAKPPAGPSDPGAAGPGEISHP
jgi:hypothetical protein